MLSISAVFQKRTKEKLKIKLRSLFHKKVESQALRILVHIRGGIGDVVMSRIFVAKLRAALPKAEIYFCHDSKQTVEMVFLDNHSEGFINGFVNKKYIPSDFDLVIRGCHFLMYDYYNLKKIKALAPNYIPAFEKALDIQKYFKIFAEYSPSLDGNFAEIMIEYGYSRISSLGLFSGLEIGQNECYPLKLQPEIKRNLLTKFSLEDKKYITIHNGMNTNTKISGIMTRNWPDVHWCEWANLFKKQYPNTKIVQIGGSTSKVFDFVDISLVGKTSIMDLPYIIDGALFHLDGETGMVHLASLTSAPAIALYGPSRAEYLAYSRNKNISAGICGGCMNTNDLWMTECVLNKPKEKQCLSNITAQQVMQKISQLNLACLN